MEPPSQRPKVRRPAPRFQQIQVQVQGLVLVQVLVQIQVLVKVPVQVSILRRCVVDQVVRGGVAAAKAVRAAKVFPAMAAMTPARR
jgi:hypothetical protein